ncbi:NAD-dependent epimerase/dehydratase family protein [Flavobacteriaceae bacterium TP-CH-4]|uniref:NAD-dependent epimerase/dehydratase family protein n=1 Tax=Pelagihabitans pacificus TaxID=2696054 RepID=A0A967E604_9FLAO|nr:NAD-dependent epimerase/dehydratase family protein [Pelagihabitans pacificus]NHF58669.1 NAD-dependent epimerase/dehydratase family protein [Pelagihabitans pacificus]
MVLVTGGTGLVGSHLLVHLLGNGISVRAIHRKGSDLQRVRKVFSYYVGNPTELFQKIDWVEADVNDIPALENAFEGIDRVYHSAAFISFDPNDYDALLKINAGGTANIVNLCLAKRVQKLCYVSSIATMGGSADSAKINEENEFLELHANVYARSKYQAELEVWRGSQEGLPVVIINPGIIIGPGFWEGGSGTLFAIAKKGYSYYLPGGTGFVGVNDVVRMLYRLMHSNVTNERYLAVSENRSYREIMTLLQTNLGLEAPTKQLQFWQLGLFRLLDWLWHSISGRGRRLTKNSIHSLRHQESYDNSKIQRDFDFSFEPLNAAIGFSCSKFMEENR